MGSLSCHRGADAVCTFVLTGRPVWEARAGTGHRGADLHHVAAQAAAGQVRTGLSASSSGGEWGTAHALSISLCTYLPIRSLIGPSQSSALRKTAQATSKEPVVVCRARKPAHTFTHRSFTKLCPSQDCSGNFQGASCRL